MDKSSQPLIVTFYSYKGGTGRSMALANVAWILATNGRRVAVIDWDLEAPGLHRYLYPYLRDPDLADSSGVIDFVMAYSREAIKPSKQETDPAWYVPYANLLRHATSLRYDFPSAGTIDFIPSGRQGADYAARVNSFNWSAFYEKHQGGLFLEAAKLSLARYDYVLIDSRTGVSDTSGICTVQMPHVLVVCFTPNAQSIQGASAIARSADQQRTRPDGTRTLTILPVMTRVLTAEKARVESARRSARDRFERLLWHLPDGEARDRYWGRMSVPQEAFYAFEEVLAVFGDEHGLSNTMLASMETLAGYIESVKPDSLPTLEPILRLPFLSDDDRKAELRKFVKLTSDDNAVPSEDSVPHPHATSESEQDLTREAQPPFAEAEIREGKRRPKSSRKGLTAETPSPAFASASPREYRFWFYLSYAHDQQDAYLGRFVDDLRERLRLFTSIDHPGFFDRTSIESGAQWNNALADALATSRTLVAMLTPRYLASVWCSRELQSFSHLRQESPARSKGILPILWVPVPVEQLPSAIAAIEIATPDMPGPYRENGLLYLMRLKRHRDDYEHFLEIFAGRLLQAGKDAPRLQSEVPPLETVPIAFAALENAPPPPAGRRVRFVFVVGNRSEMHAARISLGGYGNRAIDWMPYHSPSLGSVAMDAAATLQLHTELTDDVRALDQLDESREIGIVLIDAWALTLDRTRAIITRLDALSPASWAYVIVFDGEPETIERSTELRARVEQLLPKSRLWEGRVHEVHADGDLKSILGSTLTKLQLEQISRAASTRPPKAELPRMS